MATPRPTKRPRTRAVARRARQEVPTLASVLPFIVQEGLLQHQELGLLGQTSRQLKKQCKRDLWKALCCRQWPNTSRFTESKIDSLYGGYSGLYRFKISTIPEEPSEPPPLDPPTLRRQDVVLSLDITRSGNESLVSVFLNRDAKSSLLEKGLVGIKLKRPAKIGNAACFLQGTCSCDRPCRFNLVDDDFDVSMHLHRSDGTLCRLYQSMNRNPCYRFAGRTQVRFPIDSASKWWEKPRSNHIYLGPGVPDFESGLPFRWTPMAAEIHRRLRASIYFGIVPLVEVFEKQGENVVAITGVDICAMKRPHGGAGTRCFKSTEEAKKHGVTLLHILQELQGIQL